MSQTLESILKADGPCLSSALSQSLIAQGCKPEAARQRVSRGGNDIRRLSGLVFPKNARFLYHADDFMKERYWRHLLRDISLASPAYGPAIGAVLARGGVVPLAHFDIISGSPIRQKGQVSSSTVLQRLEAVKFLKTYEVDGIGPCVMIDAGGHFGVPDQGRLRARLITEKILLSAVRDWARRLGLASYDRIELREDGELPRCGTFHWDLCGPSYLRPMVRRDEAKKIHPGFLVCDAIAGGEIDELAMAAFLRKCQLSANLPKLPGLMPVSIADRYTREALRLGKTYGVIMATPFTLFGRDVAIGLATLLTTLSKAAAIAVARPEVIGQLFDKLGSVEGAATNLRGALFEMIVGNVTHAVEGGSIDIGRRLHYASQEGAIRAELDVLRATGSEVTIYECKGYQPSQTVTLEEVETWLKETVPGIYAWTRMEQFANHQVRFEFWTTGKFSPAARSMLMAASATKKYKVGFRDGPEVRKYVTQLAGSGILKVLDEHYFKHPIARFDTRYDGQTRLEELDLTIDPAGDLGEVGSGPDWAPAYDFVDRALGKL